MVKKVITSFLLVSFLVSIASMVTAESNYVVVPAQKPFISAESRLKDFAKKAEDARMQSAMYGIGLGVLYIALGSASSKSSYYSGTDYSTVYYACGAGMSLLGLRSLLFPTALENNYAEARKMASASIEERAARERFAEDSLRKGADEARQGRMIGSGVIGAFGLATLGSYGILYVGLAAASYLMKSDIEKAYDEYITDKEDYLKSQPAQAVVPTTGEVGSVPTAPEVK